MRHSTVAGLAALAAVSAAAALGQVTATAARASKPPPAARWLRFAGDGVAFRYPPGWRRYSWRADSMFSHAIVYLSTAAEQNPCVTMRVGKATSISCSSPLRMLEPRGVLVVWTANGFPHRSFNAFPGTAAHIGGRAARLFSGRANATCARIGGELSVTAFVAAAPGNWTQMDACLRGPGLAARERQVAALLASASFRG